ncbi:MAG: hypothetical protein ABH950_00230 [Candidatus Altiarchaeota archaeon]
MMKKSEFKRGQSALEYLMTYGWAILVVIGVGIALMKLGIIRIGPTTPPGMDGFEEVTPVDWILYGEWSSDVGDPSASKSMDIILKNDGRDRILMEEIIAEITIPMEVTCSTSSFSHKEVPPGGQIEVVFLPVNECDTDFSSEAGEYFKAKLTVNYLNMQSGLPHQSIGNIWGTVDLMVEEVI